MLSGDIHTVRASATKSRSRRWFSRVVSLARMSTVLFHREVPMTAHSVGDFLSALAIPVAIFSIILRYFWLTGRSVESMAMPWRLRRSIDLWESQREGWSME